MEMRSFLKRSTKTIGTVCLLLASVSFSFGAGRYVKKPKEKPKVPYMAIASVDAKAMTITVESRNSNAQTSKTYKFTNRTKITVNGHDGKVTDLTPGLQIRVGAGADPDVAEELSASPAPADPNKE